MARVPWSRSKLPSIHLIHFFIHPSFLTAPTCYLICSISSIHCNQPVQHLSIHPRSRSTLALSLTPCVHYTDMFCPIPFKSLALGVNNERRNPFFYCGVKGQGHLWTNASETCGHDILTDFRFAQSFSNFTHRLFTIKAETIYFGSWCQRSIIDSNLKLLWLNGCKPK